MTHTCADCGHHANEHYWERCLTCDQSGYGCECDEDSVELVDGCDHIEGLTQTCDCEGYQE